MRYLKKAKEVTVEDEVKFTEEVASIIKNVRLNGDKAILEYNTRFDNNPNPNFRVSHEEIQAAYKLVTEDFIKDVKSAYENIKAFAIAQRYCMKDLEGFETTHGIELGHKLIPVESTLCYVPGGSYPLYSSALMLITPAKVAHVKRVVACSPSDKNTGRINPKTLVAMDIAGADEIYAMGGAHTIGGFTYGSHQIKPVDMIVGPGNAYVAEAKRQCYGKIGIDFIAGPSEVLIIADETANPEIIAADILAQSEHDKVARGILVTLSEDIGREAMKCVEEQLTKLSTSDIARISWEDRGEVIIVDSLDEAIEIANEYAPEHLEIATKDNEKLKKELINYGSLFIGENTAEVFGDYASGTNHTLPTVRASRYTGGVWVGTFIKVCTNQKFTREGMKALAPLVSRLAHGEGLEGHARAAEIRYEKLS